ncbi:MAG: ATP-binding cassette domain-containing protein [Syntrophomonadaceae bacterium]|nr:ATP-binding cassette domain-containing protein [Syntrophomonadaceae bacterium]
MKNKYILEHVGYTATDPNTGVSREILRDINLTIPAGKILTITGPSGSGKSSLLMLLNLMRDATTGRILLDAEDIRRLDVLELRRRVGIVFQKPYLFKGSVEYNILLGPRLRGINPGFSPGQLLEQVGLSPSILQQEATSLSGGEQQRVTLARTLANSPEVLLLDEVTASLDSNSARFIEDLVRELCREHGLTVVWVTHDPEQVERVGDNNVMLVEGRLLVGRIVV